MKKVRISGRKFDSLRVHGNAEAGVAYVIKISESVYLYGYSDDGEGFFFYDSLAELKASH